MNRRMKRKTARFGLLLGQIFNIYTFLISNKFGKIGKNCAIRPLLNTNCPKNIFLGNNVNVGMFSWLDTVTEKNKKPKLIIGDNCSIGSYSMIIAANRIEIGKNVLTSARVTILDHIHDYQNIKIPIINQPVAVKGTIIIEDDCFIGINAVILGNLKISKHAVIGANSVVTKDVPAYSVVAGTPAKVIKKYNFKKKKWQNC